MASRPEQHSAAMAAWPSVCSWCRVCLMNQCPQMDVMLACRRLEWLVNCKPQGRLTRKAPGPAYTPGHLQQRLAPAVGSMPDPSWHHATKMTTKSR